VSDGVGVGVGLDTTGCDDAVGVGTVEFKVSVLALCGSSLAAGDWLGDWLGFELSDDF
jgi:hypothetical protein